MPPSRGTPKPPTGRPSARCRSGRLVTVRTALSRSDRRRRVAFDEDIIAVPPIPSCTLHTTCGKPFGPLMKLPYSSVASSGTCRKPCIGQIDAKKVARLRLDDLPGRHAANLDVSAVPIVPSAPRSRLVISLPVASGSPRDRGIGAQEYLMRGMRRVGLVLVDERRRRVLVSWMSSAVPSTPSAPGP